MTSAQRTAGPTDPTQALDIVFRMTRRLVDELGVIITFAPLPPGELIDFDDGTRELRIVADATLAEQVHAYGQVLRLLVFGEDAAPDMELVPMLTLVPALS